jgi:3-phenylpropionate/cinnamic acid dioxygenase small subunit
VLTDGDLVRNLLGRYCELIDAGDWDGVGALFADGALASEDGVELASGADGVAEFYRRGTRLYDGSPRTKHVVSNTQLSLDGDGDVVVARSSYVVLQGVDGPPTPIIAGRYVDTFVRSDADGAGWSWRERRFAVDLVGDLSKHLTWEPPT